MVKDIDITIVIGANYGDEGKGRMTDHFTSQSKNNNKFTINVLSNGGAQRGHTVQLDNGYRHIFQHFGSGTLAGADTYLPQSFIVNPMIFMKEYRELMSGYFGHEWFPTIYVNPECLVSTPFDMINNQIIEEHRAHKHGSCGVGIWETILRKGACVYDMMYMTDEQLFTYLKWVRDTYSQKRLLEKKAMVLNHWKDIYFNDNLIHNYIQDFRQFQKIIQLNTSKMLLEYDSIIFENGQGLKIDYDSDPVYSTPSYTGIREPLNIINKLEQYNKDYNFNVMICYVTRSYYTRHGIGNLSSECDVKDISGLQLNLNSESNNYNKNQGVFRYGKITDNFYDILHNVLLDLEKNKCLDKYPKSIAVTHCDELDVPGVIFGFNKVYKVYGPKRSDKIEIY